MVADKLSHISLTILSYFLLSSTLTLVTAHNINGLKECICLKHDSHNHDHDDDESNVLRYKVAAIFTILFASAVGVSLPILGRKIPVFRPERGSFLLVKAYSAGIILCTAFIHILPEAFENLTSPCLGQDSAWANFPFTGLTVMLGVLLTLMLGSISTRHFNMALLRDSEDDDGIEAKNVYNNNHGHEHCTISLVPHKEDQLIKQRISSQVLEIGIVVHSIIIGLSVGTSKKVDTIKPLIAALCFHQFFEGIGLGGCIVQASFKSASTLLMALCFTITTPLGVAIGIGLTNVYDETSPITLIGQGLLNSIAAGILIYMALVDLLAPDFMDPKIQTSTKLFFGAKVTLLLGVASMTILAIWA
ncbi:Zinc transporter 5 [Bienertia sinuspersici]